MFNWQHIIRGSGNDLASNSGEPLQWPKFTSPSLNELKQGPWHEFSHTMQGSSSTLYIPPLLTPHESSVVDIAPSACCLSRLLANWYQSERDVNLHVCLWLPHGSTWLVPHGGHPYTDGAVTPACVETYWQGSCQWTIIPDMSQSLTSCGHDKIAAVSKTTFSNVFSWIKMHEFRFGCHWSLFLKFQLTIIQH